jgi:hypothetical protein
MNINHVFWRAMIEERERSVFFGMSPDVPIHPGAAWFYKEKGWWDDSCENTQASN